MTPHTNKMLKAPFFSALLVIGLLPTSLEVFAADGGALEVIIVTAQKKDENLQDVPIALSVVSEGDIENRAIVDFVELFQLMPNTQINQGVSSIPSISIRGISSNANNIGIESAVGVQVDDVFLGRPSAFSSNLIDIERVEVLRGPQGTLFGKNTIGGLVNMVTRKPSREFAASVDVTVGEDDLQQVRGFLNGPLGDNLAGKISITSRQQDGWVENRNPAAEDLNATDYWGVRGQLLGQFGDNGRWLLTAEFSEDDGPENYNDVLSGPFAPFDGDPFDRSIATSENDEFIREIFGASLKLDWTWGPIDVVSITALRGVDWTGHNDQDYVSLKIFETGRTEEQQQFSQELRILGGNDSFSWIAGFFYFDQTQDANGPVIFDSDLTSFFGIGVIPTYFENATTVASLDSTSYALFASGTWTLGENWTLTGGLRFTREEKDFDYRQDNVVFEFAPGIPLNLVGAFFPPVPQTSDSLTDSDWSGDLSLSWDISNDMVLYGKVSRGFKAGGFDTTLSSSSDPGDLQFDSETILGFELGFKSVLADNRVRLNIAAFTYDYKDKQEQFFNGAIVSISNAAEASIDGIEIDITARATDWLTVGASAGFLDAEYEDYIDPVFMSDFSGNDLPRISDTSFSAYLQANHTFNNGWGIVARLDGVYRSEAFFQPGNNPNFEAYSTELVNARVAVSAPHDKYSIALWVKNALNQDMIVAHQSNPGLFTEWIALNEPLMWGVEFRANFGG